MDQDLSERRGIPIRSASRTLSILQIVNQSNGITMMGIKEQSCLPYPTVRRIVQTLVHDHFIELIENTKRYRPTPLVRSLSHGYHEHSAVVKAASPLLKAFTAQHIWPVSLVTRVGQMMVVRDSTHSVSAMTLTNYHSGAVFPLLECASGRLYLAYASEEERAALLAGAEQMDLKIDRLIFRQIKDGSLVQSIRENGYCLGQYNRFTDTPGRTSSIAVPVMVDGHLVACVVLVFFSVAMKGDTALEKYLLPLLELAQEIAVECGKATD
jgi:IclR family transcriptional regulator, mhp operon transcriptional activator